jgi:ADP-ribosylation factor family
MVGLDAAGKTTILYKLKLGEGERAEIPFIRVESLADCRCSPFSRVLLSCCFHPAVVTTIPTIGKLSLAPPLLLPFVVSVPDLSLLCRCEKIRIQRGDG